MPIVTGLNANVFRAVSGSLFSSQVNWSRGVVPTGSDVALIADNCIIDISRTLGSLIVQPGFTASINTGLTLQVNDVINVLGHLSCSGTPNIISVARKNSINSLSPASSSFNYSGSFQNVPGLSYYNLTISNNGTKTSTGDVTILNNLTIQPTNNTSPGAILELSRYNLIVSGTTSVNGLNSNTQTAAINKSGAGNVLFINNLNFAFRAAGPLDFSAGSPNVELRNGITFSQNGTGFTSVFKSGTGIWSFTTNNQTITDTGAGGSNQQPIFDGPLLIGSGITLRIGANTSNYPNLYVNKYINGVSSSSALVNVGNIIFNSKEAAETSMTTGSFDFTSSINTITYGINFGDYSATIPSRFNTFHNLTINGSGTKTLSTSSYISGSLTNNTNGTFELGNHNLFVSGTTNVGDGGTNIFRKSGSGSITFVGEVRRLGWNSGNGSFDLSGGNPNVECRGGLRTLGANTSTFKSGIGTWSFAVNNQRIWLDNYAVPSTLHFSGSVLIKDGITLTIDPYGVNGGFPGLGGGMAVVIMKDINGTTPSAKLMVSGALYFASSSRSMTTGTIDNTSIGNVIGYTSNDPSQFLVYGSNYFNLYIANSGIKYATSSLYMSGGLTIESAGNLDLGTYNMFVSGTTSLRSGSLIKTSSGDITFNGQMNTLGGSILMNASESRIELRNGINVDFSPIVPNTHTFHFTTNNQTITSSNAFTTPGISNTNLIISGAINLTISPAFGLFFTGYMDGADSNSKLTIGAGPVFNSPAGGIVYYSSPIMPMATSGTFDASSSLNVFVYNGGAQDIKGGIYRNLTFTGGTKTLRGNVSVLNTLNTGSVTVNLNGFTLTNP